MGGYPDGCTQADHDRAFNELGPSPAELAAEADAENDQAWQDELDYPELIAKNEAQRITRTITRVFVRLEQQIQYATQEGRNADASALCRIFGALSYHAYGGHVGIELGQ